MSNNNFPKYFIVDPSKFGGGGDITIGDPIYGGNPDRILGISSTGVLTEFLVQNGLSLVSDTSIELGGVLLHDTNIDLGGFTKSFSGIGQVNYVINLPSGTLQAGYQGSDDILNLQTIMGLPTGIKGSGIFARDGELTSSIIGRFFVGDASVFGGLPWQATMGIGALDGSSSTGQVSVLLDDVVGSPTEDNVVTNLRAEAINNGWANTIISSESQVDAQSEVILRIVDDTETHDVKLRDDAFYIGDYNIPWTDGTIDQILKTDGVGGVTWQDTATSILTADNGLTLDTPTNVQLGGTLLQPTIIDGAGANILRHDYSGALPGLSHSFYSGIGDDLPAEGMWLRSESTTANSSATIGTLALPGPFGAMNMMSFSGPASSATAVVNSTGINFNATGIARISSSSAHNFSNEIQLSGQAGTIDQVMTSRGPNVTPEWRDVDSQEVISISGVGNETITGADCGNIYILSGSGGVALDASTAIHGCTFEFYGSDSTPTVRTVQVGLTGTTFTDGSTNKKLRTSNDYLRVVYDANLDIWAYFTDAVTHDYILYSADATLDWTDANRILNVYTGSADVTLTLGYVTNGYNFKAIKVSDDTNLFTLDLAYGEFPDGSTTRTFSQRGDTIEIEVVNGVVYDVTSSPSLKIKEEFLAASGSIVVANTIIQGSEDIYRGGLYQNSTEYSLTGSTISFTTALVGEDVIVKYLK